MANLNFQISACERALEPASTDAISAGLAALVDAMNPPTNERVTEAMSAWWQRNEAVWVSALANIPADQLQVAFDRALVSKFFRTPADIVKHIEGDAAERRTSLARLKIAREALSRQKKREADSSAGSAQVERTPEDIAAAEETMKRVREALGRSSESAKDTSRTVGLNRDDEGSDTKTGRAA